MEKNNALKSTKIVITGPESTGKSSLCKELAKHFKTIWLPEYAREYLEDINRPYTEKDLLHITFGQYEREQKVANRGMLTFIDTSFEVLKIWSEWKYKACDPKILSLFETEQPSLYLLMSPDIPWENDPFREHPNHRVELFDKYCSLLQSTGIQYHIVEGLNEERLNSAVDAVRSFLDLDN